MCLKLAKKIIPTDRPELNEELQAEKRDTKQVLSLFSLFPLSQRAAQLQDLTCTHRTLLIPCIFPTLNRPSLAFIWEKSGPWHVWCHPFSVICLIQLKHFSILDKWYLFSLSYVSALYTEKPSGTWPCSMKKVANTGTHPIAEITVLFIRCNSSLLLVHLSNGDHLSLHVITIYYLGLLIRLTATNGRCSYGLPMGEGSGWKDQRYTWGALLVLHLQW